MADSTLHAITDGVGPLPTDELYVSRSPWTAGNDRKLTWKQMGGAYNVKAYGALGDGATNDTTAIQAAIAAANAAGGGTVYFPYSATAYVVNGTLTLTDMNNIRLVGEVTKRSQYASTSGGVYLKRVSGTGTMLSWTSVAAGTSLTGWAIENLHFDGNSLATTGLYLSDLYGGIFRNVEVRGCTTVGVDLYGGQQGSLGFQANQIDGLSIRAGAGTSGSAIGMRWGSLTPFTGNVSLNTFKNVFIYHHDGVGLDIGDADSNYCYGVTVTDGNTGAGVGVLLRASNTLDGLHARSNMFFGIQPVSGVSAQGTGSGTQPSVRNVMYVAAENGVPDPAIGASATLSWFTSVQNWPLVGVGTKTANYTAAAGELVLCSTAGGGFTVTLPTTPPIGTLIGVNLVAAGSNLTIATGGGNTIFGTGTTTLVMNSAEENILLEFVGANHWFAISHGFGASASTFLPLTGGTMSGAIAMGSNKITGGAVGSAATDFATLSNRISDFSITNADIDLNTHQLIRVAAGTSGTDGANVSQLIDGLVAAVGYKAWNYDPRLPISALAPVSQAAYYEAIWLPKDMVVTGIELATITVGTSTAPTNFYVGLYSSSLSRVAVSSDYKSSSNLTTLGTHPYDFTGTYTVPASGVYYAAVLKNGNFAGTDVAFAYLAGISGGYPTQPIQGGTLYISAHQTGQTSLPSTMTPANNATAFWMGVY